jgi:hypothetical protein
MIALLGDAEPTRAIILRGTDRGGQDDVRKTAGGSWDYNREYE